MAKTVGPAHDGAEFSPGGAGKNVIERSHKVVRQQSNCVKLPPYRHKVTVIGGAGKPAGVGKIAVAGDGRMVRHIIVKHIILVSRAVIIVGHSRSLSQLANSQRIGPD